MPVFMLGFVGSAMSRAEASAQRLFEVMDAELEVKNKEIEKLQHMLAKLEQEAPAKKPAAKKAPAKAAKASAKARTPAI